ncbi:MAG: hypothetical protein K6F88_01760 [Ruminococcus sp.]|nr:hypothetical protein [Ruminococcus sp.]
MSIYFNIYNHITPYDETEIAAEYIYNNAEVRCTKLEALKYIIAEHEYLDSVGFNIYANYASYSDQFSFHDMMNFISEKANLSKRKLNYFVRPRNCSCVCGLIADEITTKKIINWRYYYD